jgi:GDP-L-fucose synthase
MVTGGAGFIGRAVVDALMRRGVAGDRIVVPRSRECDLRILERCEAAMRGCRTVIHLAAPTGNITFSGSHPASQYRDCSLINLNVFEAAHRTGVEHLVAVGNLLAYPSRAPRPFAETTVHDGNVDPGYRGIGLSKRQLIDLAGMYAAEFGLRTRVVLGANAYGPRDHFEGEQAHVIPATIVKCFRDEDLVVWGDGSPTRDFLFVDDLAEGILFAAERPDAPELLNLGSGTEVAIRDVVTLIARLTGFRRRVIFDSSKAGGDRRRVASTDLAARLGFKPQLTLEDGLRRTIDWYVRSRRMEA